MIALTPMWTEPPGTPPPAVESAGLRKPASPTPRRLPQPLKTASTLAPAVFHSYHSATTTRRSKTLPDKGRSRNHSTHPLGDPSFAAG
jgi:hypothetical protein